MSTTRITQLSRLNSFISQMAQTRSDVDTAQKQVSSGIKVANASDNPGQAGVIAQFQSTTKRIEHQQTRIENATSLLDVQESVLSEGDSLLVRAKELATQAANGSVSPAVRAQMSAEIFGIRDALVGLGNTQYQGKYIYGGLDDDDPPFDKATPAPGYTVPGATNPNDAAAQRYIFDAESGTSSSRDVSIGDGQSVQVITPGSQVWTNAIAAVERLGRAVSGYRTTPEDLSGLPTGGGVAFNLPAETDAQTSDILESIDLLDTARTVDIGEEHSSVGNRMNRLSQAKDLLDVIKLDTDKARSSIQDVDVFEAASRLTNLQFNLQALLSTGSQINRLSLLDYL